MIHRFVYTAVTLGLGKYASSGVDLYQELFGDIWDFSATETQAIHDYFAKYPAVTHLGYPRSALSPNCVSIYIYEASQTQPGFALADQAADIQVTTPEGQVVSGQPVLGSLWDHVVNVQIFAFNFDVAAYASEMVKSIVLAAKPYFLSVAVELPTMSISEVQPAENYEPTNLYTRNISLRCRREFSIANVADDLQRAFKVDGIAFPAGSPNSNGGALALAQVEV